MTQFVEFFCAEITNLAVAGIIPVELRRHSWASLPLRLLHTCRYLLLTSRFQLSLVLQAPQHNLPGSQSIFNGIVTVLTIVSYGGLVR